MLTHKRNPYKSEKTKEGKFTISISQNDRLIFLHETEASKCCNKKNNLAVCAARKRFHSYRGFSCTKKCDSKLSK